MTDPTEEIRRKELAEINADPGNREELQSKHGKICDTEELRREFDVLGFLAPYVVVQRKSDGVKGSLKFQDNPRFYFAFKADE